MGITDSAENQWVQWQAEVLHKAAGLVVVSDHNLPHSLSGEPDYWL